MKSLIYCDTTLDKLYSIDLFSNNIEEIPFNIDSNKIGPCEIDFYNDSLCVANRDSNSIAVFNIKDKEQLFNIYIGGVPSDVKFLKDKIYITCCDANTLNIVDVKEREYIASIFIGEYPCSIEIDKDKNIGYIVSMYENKLTIFDCESIEVITEIRCLKWPIKVLLSKNREILFVCESNIGVSKCGSVTFLSTNNNNVLCSIDVEYVPTDIYEDNGLLYVSNMISGTISIISIKERKVVEIIYYDGEPKVIAKYNNILFTGDWKDGSIYSINLDKKNLDINKIASGKEPNAILLI